MAGSPPPTLAAAGSRFQIRYPSIHFVHFTLGIAQRTTASGGQSARVSPPVWEAPPPEAPPYPPHLRSTLPIDT